MQPIQFNDDFFMRIAISEARDAFSSEEVPIGAVIVAGGSVVARAHNLVESLADSTAHAEMLVLTAAMNELGSKYLTDCTLYVTLEPCIMCAGACAWAQIGRLVYGAPDPKRGFSLAGGSILHPKTQVTSGILSEECQHIMASFFKNLRR